MVQTQPATGRREQDLTESIYLCIESRLLAVLQFLQFLYAWIHFAYLGMLVSQVSLVSSDGAAIHVRWERIDSPLCVQVVPSL